MDIINKREIFKRVSVEMNEEGIRWVFEEECVVVVRIE